MLSRDIGLIGYGNSVYEKQATRTEYSFLVEAARAALASAGVDKSEIDGLAISSTTLPPDNAATAAEYLGLELSWASVSTAGGGGGLIILVEAVRQLRGEAGPRQVKNATHGLVSGYGMVGYGHGLSASAMILETVT